MTDEPQARRPTSAPAHIPGLVAIGMLLAFGTALLLSILYGAPRRLPDVALGAPLVLEIERAALGTALIAGIVVIALNLLRAGLPSKLSTSGVEWPAITVGDRQVFDQLIEATREARDAIDQLSALAASQTATPEGANRLAEVKASVARMDSALSEAEAREAIADAMAALPERERLVVALYYYENLSDAEIANVVALSQRRVRQLRTSAILRLRGQLGDDARLDDFFKQ